MNLDALVGTRVGEYEVRAKIGSGGMGVVFRGIHPVIGKEVAIKVLLPQRGREEDLARRFVAEAQAVNAIRHRALVDIFSMGVLDNGCQYFVMEYLDGLALDELFRRRGALRAGQVLAVLEEALDALVATHRAWVIHRDIKPSNLFLVSTGREEPYLKLLDFGAAKLQARSGPHTNPAWVLGTPTYMSPEQVRGGSVSPKTDIYSLGCVAFEALTGGLPYGSSSVAEVMSMHVNAPVQSARARNASVPPLVDELVAQMTAKRPEDRLDAASLKLLVKALRARFPGTLGDAADPDATHIMRFSHPDAAPVRVRGEAGPA